MYLTSGESIGTQYSSDTLGTDEAGGETATENVFKTILTKNFCHAACCDVKMLVFNSIRWRHLDRIVMSRIWERFPRKSKAWIE
jgi:hypothetical protein